MSNCHFLCFLTGFNARILPVRVKTYNVPCANIGDETIGPTSVTHESEGLRCILEEDAPVRMEFPLNIFHDSLSDIPNGSLQSNIQRKLRSEEHTSELQSQ